MAQISTPLKMGKNSGYSLIELMLVVGIIGLLAAMANMKLKSFQARARQSEAKQNLNSIYTLLESYAISNDGYPPGNPSLTLDSVERDELPIDCDAPDYCNVPNGIGFFMTNCQGRAYDYQFLSTPYRIGATERSVSEGLMCAKKRGVFGNCESFTKDRWLLSSDRVLTHASNPEPECI